MRDDWKRAKKKKKGIVYPVTQQKRGNTNSKSVQTPRATVKALTSLVALGLQAWRRAISQQFKIWLTV